jgi:hypothetical protein
VAGAGGALIMLLSVRLNSSTADELAYDSVEPIAMQLSQFDTAYLIVAVIVVQCNGLCDETTTIANAWQCLAMLARYAGSIYSSIYTCGLLLFELNGKYFMRRRETFHAPEFP